MEFHKYIRPAVSVLLILFGLWIGSSLFTYFTFNEEPKVGLSGLVAGDSYKGLVKGALLGDNRYKVASVKMTLDGEPFGGSEDGLVSVRSKKFELPFELNTTELADGRHVFEVEAADASYRANKRNDRIEFYVDNAPLKASLLEPDYSVRQGRTFHPKIKINKSVSSDRDPSTGEFNPLERVELSVFSEKYYFYPETDGSTVYEAFVPLHCEQNAGEHLFTVEVTDKVGNVSTLSGTVNVKKVEFPRQKGFHVAQEKLNDEKEVSMSSKILSKALEKWIDHSQEKKLWSGPFEVPTLVKRITTPFGEIRITPEMGRYHHAAIDIANTPRSVVWASQKGKVIIKDRYLMSGNTIVLDHGLGVFTKYFHLDDFADIEVGDMVKKGEPLGRVGMTGYANGYHLHWELSVKGQSVDPIEWTKAIY